MPTKCGSRQGRIERTRPLARWKANNPPVRRHNAMREINQDEFVGVAMSPCSFKCLLQLLSKQLDLDQQLDVYDHLERCDICRDAVYQLFRDLDQVLFIRSAHGAGHYAMRRQIKRAWSRRPHVS